MSKLHPLIVKDRDTIWEYMTGGNDLYPPVYFLARDEVIENHLNENDDRVIGAIEIQLLLRQAGDLS